MEISGDPTKNLSAFERLVEFMADAGMEYFSLNHAVDYCPICGFIGIIDDACPRCGRRDGEPVKISDLLSLESKLSPQEFNIVLRNIEKYTKRELKDDSSYE